MGEARRRSAQGLPPRAPKPRSNAQTSTDKPWWSLDRSQTNRFVSWTTRGAWIGIGGLVLFWVTVRFIGPAAGWWTLADG
ncbi:MAG: hypothetical protein RLZZ336_1538 [Cyanobacteriota bacterium]|jgi:hypothetical protein